MKRSSWLFFALLLIFNLSASMPAHAVVTMLDVAVSLGNDADGNGIFNRGDTMTITCVAFFTAPTAAWALQPTVDLTSIGMGFVTMTAVGNLWTANVLLNNFNPSTQYGQYNIKVRAQGDDTGMQVTSSIPDPFVDLCQVEGVGASAVNRVTLTNRARLGERIRVNITDNKYQGSPLGGTICTVDLTPIGGGATTPMSGAPFTVLSDLIPAGIEYTGPLTISLNDPMLGHPAVGYQTGDIIVDSIRPTVDFTNTTVVIQSGNTTALPGDVLRITAAVTAYDNETVTVTCADIDNTAADTALDTPYFMPLIISNGVGNAATWQIDVNLLDKDLKDTSLLFTFTFTDDAGNVTNVARYIAIDLDEPNVLTTEVKIMQPVSGADTTAFGTATTSCRLEFISHIDIDAGPDTLTVSVDLSPIGGQLNTQCLFSWAILIKI